jgi:hypothetical protein
VLSFKTSPGDSSVWAGAFGLGYAKFTGATNLVHKDWRATTSFLNGHIIMEEHEFAFPNIGGTIGPGANCQIAVISGDPYDRAVDCQPGGITFLEAHFGPFGDQADSFGLNIPVLFFGEGGNDLLVGDTQNDTFYGGDDADQIAGNGGRDFVSGNGGIDNLFGGSDDDTVDARDGQFFDKVDCGTGNDTAYVDFASGIPDEYNYAASHGCETILGSASAARSARTEQLTRMERMRSR